MEDKDHIEQISIFPRLENFVEQLSKKKLWIFLWGLFATSLTFIGTVLWQLFDQNAEVMKFNALNHQNIMNERKGELIIKTMNLVIQASDDAINTFNSCISKIQHNPSNRPIEDLNKSRYLISVVQNSIDAEISVITTTYFDTKDLDVFKDDFKQDLINLDASLSKMDKLGAFLLGQADASAVSFLNEPNQNESRALERIMMTIKNRVMTFKSMYERKNEINKAELEKLKAPLKVFGIKSKYIVMAAGFYIGLFSYFMISRYFKRKTVPTQEPPKDQSLRKFLRKRKKGPSNHS